MLMKKITVKDMRQAIVYVDNGNYVGNLNDLADDDLLACDFGRDLKMGNIRVANVVIELERRNQWLDFSWETFNKTRDNTVGALLDAINQHIDETAES